MNFYDTNFKNFKKNIQNGSHMMQKIVSNLVAKIICQLDIQVKSYHKKSVSKCSIGSIRPCEGLINFYDLPSMICIATLYDPV